MEIAPHSPLQGLRASNASSPGIGLSPARGPIDPGPGPSQARVASPLHAPARSIAAFIRQWTGAWPGSEALRSSLAMLGNSFCRQLLSAHSGARDCASAGRPLLAEGEATSVDDATERFPRLRASGSTSTGNAHPERIVEAALRTLRKDRPGAHPAVMAAHLSARTAWPLIDMLTALRLAAPNLKIE